MKSQLNQTLLDCLKRRHVVGPVVVAVSGGADSVAMLQGLIELAKPEIQLHVAHFQHRLRGSDSDEDAAFVSSFCGQHGLPVYLGEAATGELSPGQSHLESKARALRYRWLTRLAWSLNSRWVLTGHTLNDQAETVLHHLIRGTGWRGLRGISPVRLLPSADGTEGHRVHLLRPMLHCTRSHIEEYLADRGIQARHDASNEDLRFTRNRIRHEVLPPLVRMNREVIQHLAAWAEVARRQYRVIQHDAREAMKVALVHRSTQQLALKVQFIHGLNEDVLQEMLRQCWQQQGWPVDQMSALRWQEVMEVCRGTRKAVEVQGRIRVECKHGVIRVTK